MDEVQKKHNDGCIEKESESETNVEGQMAESRQLPSVADFIHKVSSHIKQRQLKCGLKICNEALNIHFDNSQLLEKKVKILCQLHKFQEAFELVEHWIKLQPQNPVAKQKLEKLEIILSTIDSDVEEDHQQEFNTSKDDQFDVKVTSSDSHRKTASPQLVGDTGVLDRQDTRAALTCVSCAMSFTQKSDLDRHVLSCSCTQRLVDDGTYEWRYRIPPRGLSGDEYGLCKRFMETGKCSFGKMCAKAHSDAELEEWNHWFSVDKQKAWDSKVHSGAYINQLMEKLMSMEPAKILVENLDQVKILVNADLKIRAQTKKYTQAWTFTVTSKMCLHCVALMSETYRSYFYITSLSVGPRKTQKYQNLENLCQEWINPEPQSKGTREFVYRVKVVFKTNIYGTFRQAVVFDFGVAAIVVRELEVYSPSVTDPEKTFKEVFFSQAWNKKKVAEVKFDRRLESYSELEETLIAKYSLPLAHKFCPSETVSHRLNKSNYRLWMHEMFYIEEMAQTDFLSRFSVITTLTLTDSVNATSAAECSESGEIFARMELKDDLSVDSITGHLVLQSSNVVWVAQGSKEHPDKVYEAVVEVKGTNFIFLRLCRTCVEELGLSCHQDFLAQIQFQFDRLSMCEMHSAVDKLPTLDIVFPDLESVPTKLDLEDVVLQNRNDDKQLNEKQKDAIKLILGCRELNLPPLLILGPSGTGKTFTLVEAAKQILNLEGSRVLICTNSDRAADTWTEELLSACEDIRPLRIMSKFRWEKDVADVILKCTLQEKEGPMAGKFRVPIEEDLVKHRVVITTLNCARYLVDKALANDIFSHIFVDEAEQPLESEAIIPLSLAHGNTRIVLAGDPLCINPEVFSDFSRQQGLSVSLLERLNDFYPTECLYRVNLYESYNTHSTITELTSELFYDSKLTTAGNTSALEQFYPLAFYAVKGEEIQQRNVSGFCNPSEVYEVVDYVDELRKKWPVEWGQFDRNGINVVAPYSDQVTKIRTELSRRKLTNVNVERMGNASDQQYRVIVVSITRTRLSCQSDSSMEEYVNYGFMSDVKFIHTVLSQAQSAVVVVGDPVSMCTVGKCRKIWEHFLAICNHSNSLHGVSWNSLRLQIHQAELAKSFTLNPHAPEFVPNRPFSGIQTQQQEPGWVYTGQPGAWSGYQRLLTGQTHAQILSHGYHWPMYYSLNPGIVPGMYHHPQLLSRGVRHNKQIFGRFISPGGAFHYSRGGGPMKESKPHIVEMPASGAMGRTWQGGRFGYYSPQMQILSATPYGYTQMLQPHQAGGGYFYQLRDPRNLSFTTLQTSSQPYMISTLQPRVTNRMTYHSGAGFPSHYMYTPSHDIQHIQSDIQVSYEERDIMRERSDSPDSTGSVRSTDSPTPGFQLLPNVKHIPTYLQGRPTDITSEVPGIHAASSSENSCGSQILYGDEKSSRPYSPAKFSNENQGSCQKSIDAAEITREYEVSKSDGNVLNANSRDSSHEDLQMSQEMPVSHSVISPDNSTKETLLTCHEDAYVLVDNNNSTAETAKPNRKAPELRLRTGFSRQFSDGLPTPAVITNMIQMIDENIEEEFAEDECPSAVKIEKKSRLKLKMTNAVRFQQQVTENAEFSSSSSPSSEDCYPFQTRMTDQNLERQESTSELVAQLEIQTPRTPKGFITPGTEGQVDPFGILKSLHIGDAPL